MDRLRHLIVAVALSSACRDEPVDDAPPPSRFQAVTAAKAERPSPFCEQTFPAAGEGRRAFVRPPERPVPGAKAAEAKGWVWVNVWATWCAPCMKEMPLIARFAEALGKDGHPVTLELWSVDGDAADLEGALAKGLPGPVRWLESEDRIPDLVEALGADKSSPIPIHALVDPSGALRCVRVGQIGEESYGPLRDALR